MNGKVCGFLALVLFRWDYSTWLQRAWRMMCLMMLVVSGVEFCRSWNLPSGVSIGVSCYSLLVIVFSAMSLLKDLLALFLWNDSKENLTRFKDRTDGEKKDLLEAIQKAEVETGYEKMAVGEPGDFGAFSKEFNKYLREGGKIWIVETRRFKETSVWRRINQRLDVVSRVLRIKQRADDYKGFFNEYKLMLVSNLIRSSPGATGDYAVKVAMTCYYASYMTNEHYRDLVADEEGYSRSSGVVGEWSPFDEGMNEMSLHGFDGWNSAHVGVNTIGITADGYVLIWQQKREESQFSKGEAVPTGSGSMDWGDLAHAGVTRDEQGRILFNDLIRIAAERELREESFAEKTWEKKVIKFFSRLFRRNAGGIGLRTQVIGYYRWGMRGGVPGFVCVTRILLNKNDLQFSTDEVTRNKKQLETLRLDGDPDKMCKCIDSYIEAHSGNNGIPLSVPLEVSLTFLKDALKDGTVSLEG